MVFERELSARKKTVLQNFTKSGGLQRLRLGRTAAYQSLKSE